MKNVDFCLKIAPASAKKGVAFNSWKVRRPNISARDIILTSQLVPIRFLTDLEIMDAKWKMLIFCLKMAPRESIKGHGFYSWMVRRPKIGTRDVILTGKLVPIQFLMDLEIMDAK